MNRSHYPPDWKIISFKVRTDACWTCENCGRPCQQPGQSWEDFKAWLLSEVKESWFEQLQDFVIDEESGEWEYCDRPRRFTLTVAHLDHNPANNVRSNLRALCAPCHLAYDAHYHVQTRVRKRYEQREINGQLTLW